MPHQRSHKRMLTDAGLDTQLSDVDEIVFGRDLDDSANAVKSVYESPAFAGACGSTSKMLGAGAIRGYADGAPAPKPAMRAQDLQHLPVGHPMRPTDPWGGGVFGEAINDHIHVPQGKRSIDPPGRSTAGFWGGGPYDPNAPPSALSPPLKPTRTARRMMTGAGLNSQLSDVDDVVFGRDQDGSDGAVKDVTASVHFSGAHGKTSRQLHMGEHDPRLRPQHPAAASRYGHQMLSWGDTPVWPPPLRQL